MELNTINKGVFMSDTVMVMLVNNLWLIQPHGQCYDMRVMADIMQVCNKPSSITQVNHELVRESYWLRGGVS